MLCQNSSNNGERRVSVLQRSAKAVGIHGYSWPVYHNSCSDRRGVFSIIFSPDGFSGINYCGVRNSYFCFWRAYYYLPQTKTGIACQTPGTRFIRVSQSLGTH